jgi:hypothetical protein
MLLGCDPLVATAAANDSRNAPMTSGEKNGGENDMYECARSWSATICLT